MHALAQTTSLFRLTSFHLASSHPLRWLLPADAAMAQLEAIARLAWSDETAREELGERQDRKSVV